MQNEKKEFNKTLNQQQSDSIHYHQHSWNPIDVYSEYVQTAVQGDQSTLKLVAFDIESYQNNGTWTPNEERVQFFVEVQASLI
jgi:hypothetical protein